MFKENKWFMAAKNLWSEKYLQQFSTFQNYVMIVKIMIGGLRLTDEGSILGSLLKSKQRRKANQNNNQ